MQHQRQVLLWGSQRQKQLEEAHIAVMGVDLLSQYLSIGLAGLGMGSITNISNATKVKQSLFPMREGNSISHQLSKYVQAIWPGGKTLPLHSSMNTPLLSLLKPHILVGNAQARKYGNQYGTLCTQRTLSSPIESAVGAGLLLEQLVHKLFGEEADSTIAVPECSNRKLGGSYLVVGCGALGNYCASTLTLSGARRIDFVDFDTIEEHNLNRQVFLYGQVGKYKAQVLRNRMRAINPRLETRVMKEAFNVNWLKYPNVHYDAIFSCVDSIPARKGISDACEEYQIPLINGGTSATSGSVYTFQPKQTLSIREQCSLDLFEESPTQSCQQAQPSVIIPNMIIGALMVEAYVKMKTESPQTIRYGDGTITTSTV